MKIGIVGLGLIGGSLGRTIVKNTKDEVFALDVSNKAMLDGRLLNAYHFQLSEKDFLDLDILFLSIYPKATITALEEYVLKLKKGAIVIDLCGNKRAVVEKMRELSKKYPHITFIGGHPMAGREFSGVSHSTVNLFDKASMIMVPVNAELKTLAFIKEYFINLGFLKVVITSAENHDKIIAFTSQLAHVISSAYARSETASEHLGFSAGSFRDMTRVARLSPEMWTELMIGNSDFLAKEIEQLITHLNEYKTALENKDEKFLKEILADGNNKKILYEKLKRIKNYEN